jgi:hypothetical protein
MFVLPTFGLGVIGSPIVPPFNVTNRDTEANILASTPTLSAGEAGIAFGTDNEEILSILSGDEWTSDDII